MSQTVKIIDEGSQLTFDHAPLPDGWRWVPLREVCYAVRGVTFSSGEARTEPFENSIACLTTSSVQDVVAWDSRRYIPKQRVNTGEQILRENDLLVSTANSKALVGKSCLIDASAFDCTFGAFVTVLRPTGGIEPYFLELWLRTPIAKKYCYNKSSNTTNISNLRVEDLLALEIPLPPFPEQKRITAILKEQMTTVKRAQVAAEAQLKAAKDLPAAYLRAVFDSEEAQYWEIKPLESICEGNGQYGTSEKATATEVDGLPVLGMVNLHEGQIRWEKLNFIKLSEKDEQKYRLEKGDILFNRTNSVELVGKTAVFDGLRDAVFASYLIRLRVKKDIANPDYTSAFINSKHGRRFIEANMTRAIGQANVSASVLSKMPVPVPPLPEQERIASTLIKHTAEVEQLRSAIKNQLDAINKLPAALLRQAFTRKL